MPEYLTPGVYFESLDNTRAGITAIRTDIAAFIGIAERGPLHEPWPVESWRQFQTIFGSFTGAGYLAYCAKAFFENGGRRVYIVRVAHDDAAKAEGDLLGFDGNPTLRIRASSEGRWGNALQVRLGEGRSEATQTDGAQPVDGSTSTVTSIVGFPVGALVRLYQQNASGEVEAFRVVTGFSPAFRRLTWDSPLELLPAIVPGFDLAQPIDLETVTFTLSVFESGSLRALYPDLSMSPESDRYVVDVINLDPRQRGKQATALPLIEVEDLHAGAPTPIWPDWLPDRTASTPTFRDGLLTLQCGVDGLTNLEPSDFTGQPGALQRTGLQTLELEEEVSLVAIPDILIRPEPPTTFDPLPEPEIDPCIDPPLPPEPAPLPPGPCPDITEQPPIFGEGQVLWVQQQLVLHCETMADRFALLDPPFTGQSGVVDPSEVLGWRMQFDSSFGALYYPWIQVADPLRLRRVGIRAVPPSGHVAGVIARTDLSVGVHKAPANAILEWTQGFTVPISADWQAILNPEHVNCLRALAGRGLRVYGARTVSSDTSLRFVNVRRTLLMIEKALRQSLQWVVFEPHDLYLRQTVVLAISSFLTALRARGALVGATPEEAFFVRCDAENNPPEVVDAGELIVNVGVALVRPAEFVVFRIGRTRNELEITELNTVQI